MPFSWNHRYSTAIGFSLKRRGRTAESGERHAGRPTDGAKFVADGRFVTGNDSQLIFNFSSLTRRNSENQTTNKRTDNRRNIIYFPNKNTLPARTHVNKSKMKTTNS